MLQLVIFDFDGLMVNSEEVIFAALVSLFQEHNHTFTWEYYQKSIGSSVTEALTSYYRDFPLPLSFADFVAQRNQVVTAALAQNLQMMPYLAELLEFLKQKQLKIAIATSGHREYVLKHLETFQIGHYFESLTSIEEVEKPKPSPELFLKTLEKMGVKPSAAIILEDSPRGIEAAKNAGIASIAVPTRNIDRALYKDADWICENLKAAQKVLAKLS